MQLKICSNVNLQLNCLPLFLQLQLFCRKSIGREVRKFTPTSPTTICLCNICTPALLSIWTELVKSWEWSSLEKGREKNVCTYSVFLDNISLMVCALVLLPWTWYSTNHSHHSYNAGYRVNNELSLFSHNNRKPICIFICATIITHLMKI